MNTLMWMRFFFIIQFLDHPFLSAMIGEIFGIKSSFFCRCFCKWLVMSLLTNLYGSWLESRFCIYNFCSVIERKIKGTIQIFQVISSFRSIEVISPDRISFTANDRNTFGCTVRESFGWASVPVFVSLSLYSRNAVSSTVSFNSTSPHLISLCSWQRTVYCCLTIILVLIRASDEEQPSKSWPHRNI